MVMIHCFASRLYLWRRQMVTARLAVTWAWASKHFGGAQVTVSGQQALTFVSVGRISLIETSKNLVALKARPFWAPSVQLEPLHGAVVILWDIENCGIPGDVQPEDVAGKIRVILRSHPVTNGVVKRFSAYGDFSKFSPSLREGCQKTGVTLVDVPNGRKDAADMAILVDMFQFALDNPPPSTIMLISGDVDFAPALHILGQRGYTIVLVVPTTNLVSAALINAGRFIWEWPKIVLPSSEASKASSMNSTKDAFMLQDEKTTLSVYRNTVQWALRAIDYCVCKFSYLFKSMEDVTAMVAKMKTARCSRGTDSLPSGNPHSSNRMNKNAHSCANGFRRQMPKEVKNTKLMGGCETRKRDCNSKEAVKKQNQEKKLKDLDEQLKFKEGGIASGPVEHKVVNMGSGNEIRTREMTSQICSESQTGEGLKSKTETNNEGGKQTSMWVDSSKISLVSKVGQKETTEQLTWCKVCNINCYHEGVLYLHKQGRKHKRTLEKLQKVNNDHSAAGLPVQPKA